MLVLNRNEREEIVIDVAGELIRITICDVGRGRVRVGVTASKEVPVHRREVYERIHNVRLPELLIQ